MQLLPSIYPVVIQAGMPFVLPPWFKYYNDLRSSVPVLKCALVAICTSLSSLRFAHCDFPFHKVDLLGSMTSIALQCTGFWRLHLSWLALVEGHLIQCLSISEPLAGVRRPPLGLLGCMSH